jgi:hypothetical protein
MIIPFNRHLVAAEALADALSEKGNNYFNQQKQQYGLRKTITENTWSNEILCSKLAEFLRVFQQSMGRGGVS